ncbi:hypothetical protein EDB86DRAFT_2835408 [Lactarius hatsudake]|nr:hypothetical protein EDB86DRAFT_2835408 [Lactarius hatsudake]
MLVAPPQIMTPPLNPLFRMHAASTAMSHILGLDEQDRQWIINNLLLMGMGGLTSGNATLQINAIGLGLDFAHIATIPSTIPSPLFDPIPLPPPFVASLASLSQSTTPPPPPPRSPRHPCSPRIMPPPLPVVEDDKSPRGGVKTSPLASVLGLLSTTLPHKLAPPAQIEDKSLPQMPPPRPPCSPLCAYRPVFPINALERPRDPDEVAPQMPRMSPSPPTTSARHRANAVDAPPPPTHSTPQIVDRQHHTSTARTPPPRIVTMCNRDRHIHETQGSRHQNQNQNSTRDRICAWLQQVIPNPPSHTRPRPPPPPLRRIDEERVDPELREYSSFGFDSVEDYI